MEKVHLRKQINDAWTEVYFQLGRNEHSSLSDDEFLRAHWTIYFTYSRKKGDDYVHFLHKKFSAKNIFKKKTVLMGEQDDNYMMNATYDEDDSDIDADWEMFTKTEKDKISIEHILPQNLSKYYWQNQYRQFTEEEKKMLVGALGNLLPLSQSINSSLQNDSFYDKKTTKDERRGYENGCHSEIEVGKKSDWTAENIYTRSKMLLQFMENRWEISLSKEQLNKLIYVKFAMDERDIPIDMLSPIDDNKVSVTVTEIL